MKKRGILNLCVILLAIFIVSLFYFPKIEGFFNRFKDKEVKETIAKEAEPVSYTHLDVYKRQELI